MPQAPQNPHRKLITMLIPSMASVFQQNKMFSINTPRQSVTHSEGKTQVNCRRLHYHVYHMWKSGRRISVVALEGYTVSHGVISDYHKDQMPGPCKIVRCNYLKGSKLIGNSVLYRKPVLCRWPLCSRGHWPLLLTAEWSCRSCQGLCITACLLLNEVTNPILQLQTHNELQLHLNLALIPTALTMALWYFYSFPLHLEEITPFRFCLGV